MFLRPISSGATRAIISPSVSVKRRGLEMTLAMNAVDDVCDLLAAMADDQDLAVRVDALTALGLSTSAKAWAALHRAEHDPKPDADYPPNHNDSR